MTHRFTVTRSGPRPKAAPPPPVAPAASSGCSISEPSKPRFVATPDDVFQSIFVNGVEVEAETIGREAQNHPAASGEEAWREAARALAVRELLLQEARRLGLRAQPEFDDDGRRETEEEALVRAVLDEEVDAPEPDESECRRVYAAKSERFRSPDLFEAAHILIEPASDDEQGWTQAEALARRIAAEVGDGPEVFADAARAVSACPSAKEGGSLGQIKRGDLVREVQAAIEAIPPGRTGREPVRSRFGWHVLRLDRRIEGRMLPFEMARPGIEATLRARGWTVAAGRYVEGLIGRADVKGINLNLSGGGSGCSKG